MNGDYPNYPREMVEEFEAQIAALTKERDNAICIRLCGDFCNKYETALAEIRDLTQDAERYRFLRDPNTDSSVVVAGWTVHGSPLDELIDEQIEKGKK